MNIGVLAALACALFGLLAVAALLNTIESEDLRYRARQDFWRKAAETLRRRDLELPDLMPLLDDICRELDDVRFYGKSGVLLSPDRGDALRVVVESYPPFKKGKKRL